jgi:PAS domain S-box-containing protein
MFKGNKSNEPQTITLDKNESQRLNALLEFDILDKPPQIEFDRITELASRICGTPIALISLVDSDRQWFMSNVGLDAAETARDIAFCDHAIEQAGIFEIEDATKDPRFANNPLVTAGPAIKFYAGAPLITTDGHAIGTLCTIDSVPRVLDDMQRAALESLSMQIISQLELQKANRRLKEAHDLQALINENNDSAIFVKDEEFKLVYANNALKALYPESMRDSLIGTTTVEEFSKDDANAFLIEDRKALEEGLSVKLEQLTMPTGNFVTLKTMKKRFYNSEGQRFILGIADDISEREYLVNQLLWSHQDFQKFTECIERELNSPILAMEKVIEWLQVDLADRLNESEVEDFGMLTTRITRIKSLLHAMNKYKNVSELSKTPEAIKPTDLKIAISEKIAASGVKVLFSGDVIAAPKTRLFTAIAELIDNAFEHNLESAIQIKVTCKVEGDFDTVIVSDNGKGIPTSMLEKVFSFGETVLSRDKHESSGFGLSIVKQLVTQCGGRVHAQATPDQGLSFYLQWTKTQGADNE